MVWFRVYDVPPPSGVVVFACRFTRGVYYTLPFLGERTGTQVDIFTNIENGHKCIVTHWAQHIYPKELSTPDPQ